MAKKEYKDVSLSGRIEARYLFGTLLGSDIFPFCNLPIRLAVLPVVSAGKSYHIMKKEAILSQGDSNMFQWLNRAESFWSQIRGDKAKRMDIYERINRGRGITGQSPNSRLIVIYNAAGRNNLNSCVLEFDQDLYLKIDRIRIGLNGFVGQHDTYLFYPETREEANYLTAILNSDFTFSVLKRIKSARHIEKKVWELPIPTYDPRNSAHVKLVRLGKLCAEKAEEILKEELKVFESIDAMQTGTTGILRKKIKSQLSNEIPQIDELVTSLLR